MITLLNKKFKPEISLFKALSQLYGLSEHRIKEILNKTGINPYERLGSLIKIPRKWEVLNYELGEVSIRFDHDSIGKNSILFKENQLSRLKRIKCNRGYRLIRGYPNRGQRTRSNGKTAKKKLT